MTTKDKLLAAIIRLLDRATENQLRSIYQLVLHTIK